MAAPNARNIFRFGPSRLISAPTNLSLPSPYNGTQLGIARNVVFRPGQKVEESKAEEFGRPVAFTLAGEEAVIACVLRTWDNDMLSTILPNSTAPTNGRLRSIDGRASGASINRAGFALDSLAFVLLVEPINPSEHPAVIMYNAVPIIDENAEIFMSHTQEFGMGLMFKATPDATGRDYSKVPIADMSL